MSIEIPGFKQPVADKPEGSALPTLGDTLRVEQDADRLDFMSTLQVVSTLDPGTYRKASAAGRKLALPADVLYRNKDQLDESEKSTYYGTIFDQYRKTANAMRDGNLAAVSQDDLDTLKLIEGAAQDSQFNKMSAGEKLFGAVSAQVSQMGQGSDLSKIRDMQRIGTSLDAVDAEVAAAQAEGRQPYEGKGGPTGFAFDYLNSNPEQRLAMRERLGGQQLKQAQNISETQQELDANPVEPGARRIQELQSNEQIGIPLGGTERQVIEGLGESSFDATLQSIGENPGFALRTSAGAIVSSAPMLVAGALTGVGGAAAAGFGTEYDVKFSDVLREAGVDFNNPKAVLEALQDDDLMTTARSKAALKAAGTTAVDTLGMGLAGRLLAPTRFAGRPLSETQREVANLAVQFPVQGISEGAGEAAGQFAAEGKVDAGEVLLESVAGAAGSSLDVLAFGGPRLMARINTGLKQSREARAGSKSMDAAAEAALASKLRAEDPGSFHELVTQQLADSPMQTVWLPAEALQRLNQSSQVDIPALLAKVPGLTEQYADAVARGGSISMTGADYLTYLADYNQQLSSSVRLTVDGMSVEDAKVWTGQQEEQIGNIAEEFAKGPDVQAVAHREVMGELIQAGFRRQDAEQYAALHLSVLNNLAERTGQALDQLRQQFPLDIRTKAPEQLRAVPVDDARLAIQRLRAGDIPKAGDMFGKSISEYLRDSGGLNDAGGELAALDADVGKVGRNRLARKDGRSLDDAAMAAWENGYFPGVAREDVTPQLIVDAVRDEMAGKPRYSAEQENATLRDQAALLTELGDYFGKLGLDINELSDDEALAVLRGDQQPDAQGQRLDQFAGPTAWTADGVSLNDAKARIADGENAEQVRKDTGWFQGADGRWRFEIDDSTAQFKPLDEWVDRAEQSEGVTLADVLEHPALLAAYPELAQVGLRVNPGRRGGGMFSAQPGRGIAGSFIEIGDPTTYQEGEPPALDVLMHEIQHAIQAREGFATGGSPEVLRAEKDQALADRDYWATVSSLRVEAERNGGDYEQAARDLTDIFERAITDQQMQDAKGAESSEAIDQRVQMAEKVMRTIGNPTSTYKRLAGEVEARNTEARRTMTADERRAASPEQTADTPVDQAIVWWNGSEMNSASVAEQAAPTEARLNQSDLERLAGMTEDEYIAAVNPDNKRTAEDDIVIVKAGDLSVPADAQPVSEFTDKQGNPVQIVADEQGILYAVQDGKAVGQIENQDGETLSIVVDEAQGRGIGAALAAALVRRDPFAPAGSFSPAGEAARRSAFRTVKAEVTAPKGTKLLTENSPPPAPGMTRLYRGEHKNHDRDVFITDDAPDGKVGGWFTPDLEYADYYKTTQETGRRGPDRKGRIVYVDLTKEQVDQYRVRGTELGEDGIRAEEDSYFIPTLRREEVIEPDADTTLFQTETRQDFVKRLEQENPGLKLDLLGNGPTVTLSRIELPKDGRNQGTGTKIMQAITGWADANGKQLALTASSDFGGTKGRLVDFYKRFGFVENKGKNRDFEVSEAMYRQPRLNQGANDEDARGFITFTPRGQGDRKFQITLGEKRDLSTLVHELGHFYLEVMQEVATSENAPEQIKNDVNLIRSWVGAEGDAELTVDQHEQFARGFEHYLAEGKAPSPELSAAFARFKRWLISIYKDLRRLNVELTDDVRKVFDRLVASDDQIMAAEQVANAIPLFKDAQAAGMTEQEFTAYQDSIELAHTHARDSIEEEIVRDEDRRRGKWWREELDGIRREVGEEVDLQPEYAAIKALRTGEMPDGSEGTIKLNSAELSERYGKPVTQRMAFMHSRTGVPLDMAANMLGFESGDALVKAIMGALPRNMVVQDEANRRMEERHGTLRANGESADKAQAAIHNERRADVLAKELRRLAQVGNRKNVTSQQILKEAARRVMSERKVRDIQPAEYQRAEAKASRETFQAFTKGDFDAAYQAKQRQLLNFYLYREAVKARADIDGMVTKLNTYNRNSVRQRIGKAGGDFLDQIDAVMEQYEFRNVSLRQLDKRKTFGEWYNDQVAAGNDPVVPEFILNSMGRTNYKELSLAQLQELDEFVAHLDHLSKLKGKLQANKKVKDQKEAEALLIRAMTDNLKRQAPRALNDSSRTLPQAMGDWMAEGNSSLMKLEQIIEQADGGDPNGAWSSIWWQPLAEAQGRRDDLNRKITKEILDATKAWFDAKGSKAGQRFDIPGVGSLDYNGMLAVALNSGNASNLKKLLDGNKIPEASHADIIGRLDKDDWQYVQNMWDTVESLWPDIVALEKQVNGVSPDKVEPTPITTQHGVVTGGYWPLVYDFMSPAYAKVLGNLGDLSPLNEQGGVRASTPKGHTKARIDGFAAPIVLDVTMIANHISGVIHDLTHRVAIADARKLITAPTVRAVMNERMGPFQAQQFVNVLDGIANDLAPGSAKGIGVFRRTMSALRGNAAVAWMGYSVTTMLNQFGGYAQALDYFAQKGQRKEYMRAIAKFAMDPIKQRALVMELSAEMRNRAVNLDPAIRAATEQIIRVGEGRIGTAMNKLANGRDAIKRYAFVPMSAMQSVVDTPVWMAAYEANGGANSANGGQDAIHAADRAVRLTQMAGGAKDLSPIQQNEMAKFFLMVYGYASLLWNRNVDIARSGRQALREKDAKGVLVALERFVYLNVIPSILAGAVKGALPDGDDDDDKKPGWAEYLAIQTLLSVTNGVPLARDAAAGLFSDFGYGGASPLGGGIDAAIKATNSSKSEALVTNMTSAVGMLTGLPSSQVNRATRTFYDVGEGEMEADALTIARGILFGPPAK